MGRGPLNTMDFAHVSWPQVKEEGAWHDAPRQQARLERGKFYAPRNCQLNFQKNHKQLLRKSDSISFSPRHILGVVSASRLGLEVLRSHYD